MYLISVISNIEFPNLADVDGVMVIGHVYIMGTNIIVAIDIVWIRVNLWCLSANNLIWLSITLW